MKFFIQEARNQQSKDVVVSYKVTPRYIEIAEGAGGNVAIVYIVFRDAESLTVAACLDTFFEEVKTDEDIRAFRAASPTAEALLWNTINHDYLTSAIIRSRDLDDGTMKTFVVSVLENLEIATPEDFFERQILRPKVVVLEGALAVISEPQDAAKRSGVPLDAGAIGRALVKGMTLGLFFGGSKISLGRNLLELFVTRKPPVSGPADPHTIMDRAALEAYIKWVNGRA